MIWQTNDHKLIIISFYLRNIKLDQFAGRSIQSRVIRIIFSIFTSAISINISGNGIDSVPFYCDISWISNNGARG